MYSTIDRCRICGSDSIVDLINYGNQPLANSLKVRGGDKESKIPLTLAFCTKSNHVQLKETVDKELLFSSYIWVTGTATSTKRFAKEFAQRVVQITSLKNDDLVIEIASNDGTFLKPFKRLGFSNILGVDPAENLKNIADQNGIRTITAFWDKTVSENIVEKYGKAKVVIARNVLPHVSQIFDVVDGIRVALRDDGVAAIEFHSAGTILDELHYDSVYHEHLCYFSIRSIRYLFEKYSLYPFHADPSPISGGGHVLYLSPTRSKESDELSRFVEREESNSVNSLKSWQNFAERCIEHKRLSREIIEYYKGKRIIGFGASARSSTYLNFCQFGSKEIEAIIDNNTMKQGKFTPGSSIPIISLDEGFRRPPDVIFVLAWNFKNEIIDLCQSKGYRGKFIVPFPNEPRVIS